MFVVAVPRCACRVSREVAAADLQAEALAKAREECAALGAAKQALEDELAALRARELEQAQQLRQLLQAAEREASLSRARALETELAVGGAAATPSEDDALAQQNLKLSSGLKTAKEEAAAVKEMLQVRLVWFRCLNSAQLTPTLCCPRTDGRRSSKSSRTTRGMRQKSDTRRRL